MINFQALTWCRVVWTTPHSTQLQRPIPIVLRRIRIAILIIRVLSKLQMQLISEGIFRSALKESDLIPHNKIIQEEVKGLMILLCSIIPKIQPQTTITNKENRIEAQTITAKWKLDILRRINTLSKLMTCWTTLRIILAYIDRIRRIAVRILGILLTCSKVEIRTRLPTISSKIINTLQPMQI